MIILAVGVNRSIKQNSAIYHSRWHLFVLCKSIPYTFLHGREKTCSYFCTYLETQPAQVLLSSRSTCCDLPGQQNSASRWEKRVNRICLSTSCHLRLEVTLAVLLIFHWWELVPWHDLEVRGSAGKRNRWWVESSQLPPHCGRGAQMFRGTAGYHCHTESGVKNVDQKKLNHRCLLLNFSRVAGLLGKKYGSQSTESQRGGTNPASARLIRLYPEANGRQHSWQPL